MGVLPKYPPPPQTCKRYVQTCAVAVKSIKHGPFNCAFEPKRSGLAVIGCYDAVKTSVLGLFSCKVAPKRFRLAVIYIYTAVKTCKHESFT
jgi:hypothetical protein